MSDLATPARAYHQRSKHALNRYAAGPETLDWDAQPDPWRRWAGAPWQPLPLIADDALPARWPALHRPGAVPAQPLHVNSVSALLALAFGLAAWKTLGPDRWAVRCNPSSGNLHPTEAYVLARKVSGIQDGLWHYTPREHGLEQRAAWAPDASQPPALWLGLTSVHWREAWKYGERAFRYCQLDAGHAVGAVRYAAALLGWQARVLPGLGHAQLAGWLGTDRSADFGPAEAEEPELLMAVGPAGSLGWPAPHATLTAWQGRANRLDRHPMYRWPVIDTVALATRPVAGADAQGEAQAEDAPVVPSASPALKTPPAAVAPANPASADAAATDATGPSAQQLIRQRRSAQRFDRQARISAAALAGLVQALAVDPQRPGLPWDVLGAAAPQVHPVFFAHRVDGLAPGAYVLPRSAAGEALLRAALPATLDWHAVALPGAAAGGGARLWRLVENPALAGTLRTLNCHQALGSDAAVAVALLAAFDGPLDAHPDTRPDAYRRLLREAGLVGQVLYLQAESLGLRGTGIGCYFDDAVHQLLGLADGDTRLQSLYHFTLGVPVADARIATDPPYAHLHVDGQGQPGQAGRPVLGPEDFR